MSTYLRKLLRKLIGWDALIQNDILADRRIDGLVDRCSDLEQKLKRFETRNRDKSGAPVVITDWETIQARYAANPDNFKEN